MPSAHNTPASFSRPASAPDSDGRRLSQNTGSRMNALAPGASPGNVPLTTPGDADLPKSELTVGRGRFTLRRRIGSGSFGDVYEGWDKKRNDFVAVKLEHQKARHPQLKNEARVYKCLNAMRKRQPGFSALWWDGEEGDFSVMVMDMLGPSLETLLEYCNRKFTLKTVLMLADQTIRRLETLHGLAFIHRDIKPENFVMGRGSCGHHVYMIDYGLSKRYWNLKEDKHSEYAMGRPLIGTARYSSLHTHIGIEQSRRDDLESLGYMWMYCLRGFLPWMGITADTNDEKIMKIGEKKESTSIDMLCKGEHPCWRKYLRYVRTMQYEEQPEYARLRKLFRRTIEEEGEKLDWQFDWMTKRRAQLTAKKKQEAREEKREARRRAIQEKRAAGVAGENTDTMFKDDDDDWEMQSQCSSASALQQPEIPFATQGTLERQDYDRHKDDPTGSDKQEKGSPGRHNSKSSHPPGSKGGSDNSGGIDDGSPRDKDKKRRPDRIKSRPGTKSGKVQEKEAMSHSTSFQKTLLGESS